MRLTVSAVPHIRAPRTTRRIMLHVLVSLLPSTAAAIVYFGWTAALAVVLSLASAVLTEFVYYLIQHAFWKAPRATLRNFAAQFDFTSAVTGLLLALTLPSSVGGLYLPVLGSAFAIAVVKMLFGGTGKNIVNPALAGRIFLFISFTAMTVYPLPAFGPLSLPAADSLTTGATQLNRLLHGESVLSLPDLLLGTGVSGCMGETCKVAILAGYVYLCATGVIKWYLPLLYVGTCGLFGVALEGFDFAYFLPSVLSGGLLFGAVFMATDYVTTPKTRLGNILYFIALGLLTAGLRKATAIETVSFCILLMNFTVFLLDILLKPRPFGKRARRKEAKR